MIARSPRVMKEQGPIWLGLTERVSEPQALSAPRRYPPHGVALGLRAARATRRCCSPAPLLGMAVTYLAPPLLAIFGGYPVLGIWRCGMAPDGDSLPADIALLSLLAALGTGIAAHRGGLLVFTFDSAYQHWRGRGGMWKGRPQALPEKR